MKPLKTLVPFALLLTLVPWLRAQESVALEPPKVVPPPQAAKFILLKVQVLALAEAKLKENNQGKMPPKVFVVPASPLSVANLVKLGGKIIAEPSLVTTDGRTASFLSGGEAPVTYPGDGARPVDWLTFGTKLEFHPRILADGKISLKFRFEQTSPAEESPRDKFATALSGAVLTSGIVSEGVATLKEGESVFATIPLAKSAGKEDGGDVLIMFFTPEITEDSKILPTSATTPTEAQSVPIVDIQTKPARVSKLQGDRRADLVMEVSETGYLESPEIIHSVVVSQGRVDVVKVTAETNQRLLVQGKQVGETILLITDKNGQQYEAFVQVQSAKGTATVQDTLSRLFPDAQIEVTAINESLLLRGILANEGDLIKITEIAEQFAPKVLNHLKVAPGQVISGKPTATPFAPSMALPAPLPKDHTELEELRDDVKALRQDVKRLIEILERKAAAKSNATPFAPALPQATSEPLVPHYGDPVTPYRDIPHPVVPTPKKFVDPLDLLPSLPPQNPAKPPAIEPQSPSAKAAQDRVETKPLPDDLDPSAFVTVQTYKIAAPKHLGNPVTASFGSGVVIESERGKAVILTAAHLLKDYESGKHVLQVGAGRQIEADGKTWRVGGPFPATIILRDDKTDIALLRAKVPVRLATIPLTRHSLPGKQDIVRCIGFSKDRQRAPEAVNAKVVAFNRFQGPENFMFDCLIPNGFGGAAVLDDSLKLIGIAMAVDPQGNQTVCSPAAEIRKLLASSE